MAAQITLWTLRGFMRAGKAAETRAPYARRVREHPGCYQPAWYSEEAARKAEARADGTPLQAA